mmetsp:Transcript_14414/g.27101  ORF Transcript_14414/g.27101 Transcript_14414/m.27101 type:complete len:92 (+) Transcript_14414:2120-2395(+)
MPPRFPHGLKRSPMHMNASEKSVLAALGLSVFAGLFHLTTSPLYHANKEEQTNPTTTSTSDGNDNDRIIIEKGNGNDDKKTSKKPVYPFSV